VLEEEGVCASEASVVPSLDIIIPKHIHGVIGSGIWIVWERLVSSLERERELVYAICRLPSWFLLCDVWVQESRSLGHLYPHYRCGGVSCLCFYREWGPQRRPQRSRPKTHRHISHSLLRSVSLVFDWEMLGRSSTPAWFLLKLLG
jgi:hypothetical protein